MANARSEATKRWREKTGLKLVQAYLHADTIAKLDRLVKSIGASGRAAVLADLIDKATAQEQPQPPALAQPQQAMPEAQPTKPLDLCGNDHRCQAQTGTGERCKTAKNLKLIEFHINDKPISAWACHRHVDRFKPCASLRQAVGIYMRRNKKTPT